MIYNTRQRCLHTFTTDRELELAVQKRKIKLRFPNFDCLPERPDFHFTLT
jgi:hypothetical protein